MSVPPLGERIAQLPKLPIAALRALWQKTFRTPPLVSNRRFLERRLAYHWQARVYEAKHPGVMARQRQQIAALNAALERARRGLKPGMATLVPGTVLMRVFRETSHEVRVLESGKFEYQGARYGSLSEVARLITGTRWSGPAFFGLKSRTRAKNR